MAHNLIDSVTRLAQMAAHTRTQYEALDAEWNRLYTHAVKELEQIQTGLDDVASMLGIIEPREGMPMLPARVGTGPQPTFDAFSADGDVLGGHGDPRNTM